MAARDDRRTHRDRGTTRGGTTRGGTTGGGTAGGGTTGGGTADRGTARGGTADAGTAGGGAADHDAVDAIEARWRELRPDVDPAPVAIVGRLLRAAALTTRRSDEALAAHGLTRGEFDLLSALRRADGLQRPSDLTTVSLVSPAATTKRLKALTARGLVARTADPDDGRGALIALTDAGRGLIDRVFPAQLATEHELLAAIPDDRRDDVVTALRLLLASVEHER